MFFLNVKNKMVENKCIKTQLKEIVKISVINLYLDTCKKVKNFSDKHRGKFITYTEKNS